LLSHLKKHKRVSWTHVGVNGTRCASVWALNELDECVNRNCTQRDIPKRPAECYSKRYSLSFDGNSRRRTWHLGLGELPLVRASASCSARARERERKREPRSRAPSSRGTSAREEETGGGRGRERNLARCRSGATTSCVICDVSPKRPNSQSSFLHVG